MKLPNGYGTVYKLTGNRRRPWVVKKTIDGRQKPLGYFTTREEAFAFIVSVNHMTPEREVTFSAVYHAWSRRHFETIGKSFPFSWRGRRKGLYAHAGTMNPSGDSLTTP